jgi:hypothetical protein
MQTTLVCENRPTPATSFSRPLPLRWRRSPALRWLLAVPPQNVVWLGKRRCILLPRTRSRLSTRQLLRYQHQLALYWRVALPLPARSWHSGLHTYIVRLLNCGLPIPHPPSPRERQRPRPLRPPLCADKKGYVVCTSDPGKRRLHRAVCEVLLGRPLQVTEHVHHRNGVRADNRPANLVILDCKQHSALGRLRPYCRTCLRCGKLFEGLAHTQVFCSGGCAKRARSEPGYRERLARARRQLLRPRRKR